MAGAALAWTLAPAHATADDLDHRREQVRAQLSDSQRDLGESSAQLARAAVAVQGTQTRLSRARRVLSGTRTQLSRAGVRDRAAAAKLSRTQAELATTRAAVHAGQHRLDSEQRMAGAMARDQYQQQTSLLPVAMLTQSRSMADLQTRLQWSTTMFDTTQAQITRLTSVQRSLEADQQRQTELEKQVASSRRAVAAQLVLKSRLERRATAQAGAVSTLLQQRTAARAAAARAVTADRQQVADLNRERKSVEHRIAVRIAQAKAAARRAAVRRAAAARRAATARRAAEARQARLAERRAAQRRAAQRQAEAVDRANEADAARVRHRHRVKQRHVKQRHVKHTRIRHEKVKHRHVKHTKRVERGGHTSQLRSKSRSTSGAHHGFRYPLGARITSPYGRRFHPVLHIWKLHDGTDFGAGCGTPIHAAYSGRVAERYYNGAYGNRLMIDHGTVAGRFVTTGYNHAKRYRVHVGQHVRRGQVIGYVGATGYATGCHLHLMVWLDGRRVNPMSWY